MERARLAVKSSLAHSIVQLSPTNGNLSARAHTPLIRTVYHATIPRLRFHRVSGTASHDGVVRWAITAPRAPLPEGRRYLPQHGIQPMSASITSPLSLILAHASDLSPLIASVSPLYHESLQVAARPCWELALPDVISSIFI